MVLTVLRNSYIAFNGHGQNLFPLKHMGDLPLSLMHQDLVL